MSGSPLLAALCMALAATTADRPAAVGDYVVVYAGILGCPDFPGVIAVPRVTAGGTIELPQLPPIDAANANAEELLTRLASAIANIRPHHDAPQSLRIEILGADDYATVSERYLASLRFRTEGRCNSTTPRGHVDDPDLIDWNRMAARPPHVIVRPG